MSNNELTLDQLQAIAGGGRAERQARRQARRLRRQERRDIREAEREYRRTGSYPCTLHCPLPD